MQPSNAKVVWAFGRLIPYIKGMIYRSRFISTLDKDRMMNRLEDMKEELDDVVKREGNIIPFPVSVQRRMEKERNKGGS